MIPYWYVPAWYRDRTGGLLLIVFISIDAQYEGKVLCVVAGCQRCVSRSSWEEATTAAVGTFLLPCVLRFRLFLYAFVLFFK